MKNILKTMKTKVASTSRKKIIFPEYMDERVLRAANRLAEENIITPVYIGDEARLQSCAERFDVRLAPYEMIHINQDQQIDSLVHAYVESRSGKIDETIAYHHLQDPNYFATLLVHTHRADGLVSGAIHTTSEAVLPALQIIKPQKEMKKVSGAYLLIREEETYLFADCAININPTSEELAEIALQSAKTAELLQMDPNIAMLSFSTKGSAQSPETAKIIEALQMVQSKAPTLSIDGEVQFDAAYMPTLAKRKSDDISLQGKANVFVFPNLEAGNISCKIAERLGGFQAIGPMIQGLNKPVNLLSRGCSEDDVYNMALFTAMQSELVKTSEKYV